MRIWLSWEEDGSENCTDQGNHSSYGATSVKSVDDGVDGTTGEGFGLNAANAFPDSVYDAKRQADAIFGFCEELGRDLAPTGFVGKRPE